MIKFILATLTTRAREALVPAASVGTLHHPYHSRRIVDLLQEYPAVLNRTL